VKGKNILADPRMMLAVDDERPPFALVLIEGSTAATEPSGEDLLRWTTRIAARFIGAPAGAYGRRNPGEGEFLVRVPLSKVRATKGVADW
jgi:hypothetical protein